MTQLADDIHRLQRCTDDPRAVLVGLNHAYIQAYLDSDPIAFDALLAPDFAATLSDGKIIQRAAFLALATERHGVREHHVDDLVIRVYGPCAVVTATTRFLLADGTRRETRYTDVYAQHDGRWYAVAAQLTRVVA